MIKKPKFFQNRLRSADMIILTCFLQTRAEKTPRGMGRYFLKISETSTCKSPENFFHPKFQYILIPNTKILFLVNLKNFENFEKL
jgi:hypothetical protein